jgi:hypothetical protein
MNNDKASSQATNNSLPWHARAYGALQGNEGIRRDFAKAFIDEHVRAKLTGGRTTVDVQRGLDYDVDIASLVDDFTTNIESVVMEPVPGSMGETHIKAEITAYTYDRAKVVHDPTPGEFDTQPGFENTEMVRCDLGVGATFAQIVGSDVYCSVYVPDE